MNELDELKVGESVFSRTKKRIGKILEILPRNNFKVDFGNNEELIIGKEDLIPFTCDPFKEIQKASFDELDIKDCVFKIKAYWLSHKYKTGEFPSLISSKVQIYPHQISVVHKVCKEGCFRFLIADEVGLGKTIEAGLILKELKTIGVIKRILIIVPASIINQWDEELKKKFNETFEKYDFFKLKELKQKFPERNPWGISDQIICSLQFAREEKNRKDITSIHWDLVIIDEAHHLRRKTDKTTKTYKLGEELAFNCDFMLLLTATPLQLEKCEFASLLQLLNFDEHYFYLTSFLTERINRIFKILYENHSIDKEIFNKFIEKIKKYYKEKLPPLHEKFKNTFKIEKNGKFSLIKQEKEVWNFGFLFEKTFPIEYIINHYSEKSIEEVDKLIEELEKSKNTYKKLTPSEIEEFKESLISLHPLCNLMVRNRRRPLFQSLMGVHFVRKAKLHYVEFTSKEMDFYNLVTDYTKNEYLLSEKTNDKAKGFVMVIFQKLLTSSIYTLLTALKRRKEKLKDKLKEIKEGKLLDKNNKENNINDIKEEIEEKAEIDLKDLEELLKREYLPSEKEIENELEIIDKLIKEGEYVKTKVDDSKFKKLEEIVEEIFKKNDKEKILIYTQFLATQEYLNDKLSKKYKVVVYNGKMKSEEKDEAVEKFKNYANIMISTEAGGEGRNLQFCHIMINYDLPWNPMKIEQRIGRLDRIGQTKDIEIHNFAIKNTIEGRIVEILQERINLFETYIGNLDPIIGETEEEIIKIIMEQNKEQLELYAKDLELKIQKALETEEKLKDFVMDMNSFRNDMVEKILPKYEKEKLSLKEIEKFTIEFLSRYPSSKIEKNYPEIEVYHFKLPEVLIEDIKKITQNSLCPEYFVTFNPDKDSDKWEFSSFGHPLFESILIYCKQPYFLRGKSPQSFGNAGALQFIDDERNFSFSGWMFNYVLELTSPIYVKNKEILIPVFIDKDGKERNDLCEYFLEKISVNNIESLNQTQSSIFKENLTKIEEIKNQVERIVVERKENEIEKFKKEIEKKYATIKNKIEKSYEHKIFKEEKELENAQKQLNDIEKSEDKEKKKIIPAIKGQIEKCNERIKNLKEEKNKKLEDLEKQKTEINSNIKLVNILWITTPNC